MSDTLTAKKRTETGTLRMRRLREQGYVPAVLYGHGEENVCLKIEAREIDAAIRHGSQMVELKGDLDESALIKQVQWGPLGSVVLHLDLIRVDATEQIEVTIPIELRGVAPGVRQGGIVNQVIHEAMIRCPANQLPEKFEVNINELDLDQTIPLSVIQLPPDAELLGDPDDVVVQCMEPVLVPEEEEGVVEEGLAAEPEVIGRKDEDEDESGEGGGGGES